MLPPQIGFSTEPPQTAQQSLFPLHGQPGPLEFDPEGKAHAGSEVVHIGGASGFIFPPQIGLA
jgi:hypothetical protein